MANLKEHEDLLIIDQLNEGVDWFKLVYGQPKIEIARRIKATSTATLKKMASWDRASSKGAQLFQLDYAAKEFAARQAAGDPTPNGDPRYVGKVNGYGGKDPFSYKVREGFNSDGRATIREFIAEFSNSPEFKQKSKREIVEAALAAFFEAQEAEATLQEKRQLKIVSLATKATNENLVKYFIHENADVESKSALQIKDLYESFVLKLLS